MWYFIFEKTKIYGFNIKGPSSIELNKETLKSVNSIHNSKPTSYFSLDKNIIWPDYKGQLHVVIQNFER